jgi:hypothetical protein
MQQAGSRKKRVIDVLEKAETLELLNEETDVKVPLS